MDIVEEMRGFEIDHEPDGWPGVRMRQVSALCDEVERLREALRIANAATADLLQAGAEAADVLRQEATILRDCHTLSGEWDGSEPEVEAGYYRFMALADRLTPNAEVS
jgi:hypothetical protein